MKVLLTGGAATWLESLTADQTDTWQHLHDVFKTRYTAPSFMKFKSAKDLFSAKQTTTTILGFSFNISATAALAS